MTQSVASRLWIYQSERFPLKKTAPLLAVFSAASICASATLAGRELPGIGAFMAGFVIAMCLFFQMRVCDEVKDFEDDLKYRPDRPIQRGLVSLRMIVGIGLFTVPVAALVAWLWHPPMLWLLAIVWVWLAAMTFEFGVPAFLKSRPILYLLSHMAIMPLIDVFLTGLEWLPSSGASSHLWLFIALSFINGCILEIGRKLWVPLNEIEGVQTYSGLWGPQTASIVWFACIVGSFILLCGIGHVTNTLRVVAGLGSLCVIFCGLRVAKYLRTQTPEAQDEMDTAAGLWVFACYAIAGFVPMIVKAL